MVIQPTTVIYSVLLLNFIHAVSSYKFNKVFKNNYILSRKLQKVVLKKVILATLDHVNHRIWHFLRNI